MRTLTKFMTASAVALAAAAIATAGQAAQVIASQLDLSQNSDFTWTNNGVTGAGAGGTLVGSATGVSGDNIAFLIPALSAFGLLSADFTLNGVSSSGPATEGGGATWTQTGLNGAFSFIYTGPAVTVGGTTITAGANLLSGTFTDAWIQGGGTSGSTNVTVGNGGAVCFTSDFFASGCGANQNSAFAFNMNPVDPGFAADPGKGLGNFVAYGNGTFSVPEPSEWALMIIGFGSAGAMLRRRRVVAAAA